MQTFPYTMTSLIMDPTMVLTTDRTGRMTTDLMSSQAVPGAAITASTTSLASISGMVAIMDITTTEGEGATEGVKMTNR